MNDYARFVAARIEEDEANAGDQHRTGCGALFQYVMPCTCGVPERIRRWCATGRELVAIATSAPAHHWLLRKLAEPDRAHPDHPDHQETT